MDIVLGVSMAPASVQMVLLQGENADGATVDENEFAVTAADDSPTVSASDRVIAAILGTREDAVGAGLDCPPSGWHAPTSSKRQPYATRWPPTKLRTSCWSRRFWPRPL